MTKLSHFIFKRQMFYYKALYSLKLSRLNLWWATLTPNKTFQLLSRYLTSVLTSFRCGALALPAKDLYHFHSETFTKNLRQVLTSPCNGKIEKKRLDQSKRSFPQLILSLWMLQNHYYHYFSSDKIRPKDNLLACDIFGYFMLLYNKKILWIEKRRKGVNLTFQTMASTTSDLTLLGRKLGALDYNPELYVKEIARRSVGGHELLQQRSNIKVTNINCFW